MRSPKKNEEGTYVSSHYISFLHRSFPARKNLLSQFFAWYDLGPFFFYSNKPKRKYLKKIAKTKRYTHFVETGTFEGLTTKIMGPYFEQVHTIELSPEYVNQAKENLKNLPNVQVHQGDSGTLLPQIAKALDAPALFFIDAHYNPSTGAGLEKEPIFEELNAIFTSPYPHRVIIDDMSHFKHADPGFPTYAALLNYVKKHRPNDRISIHYGMLDIEPQQKT